MRYDFERGEYVRADGRAASDEDFKRITSEAALSGTGSRYRAGIATLKRASLVHTLLREKGEEGRRRILEAVSRQLSGRRLDKRLRNIFYSKAPAQAGVSVSGPDRIQKTIWLVLCASRSVGMCLIWPSVELSLSPQAILLERQL